MNMVKVEGGTSTLIECNTGSFPVFFKYTHNKK